MTLHFNFFSCQKSHALVCALSSTCSSIYSSQNYCCTLKIKGTKTHNPVALIGIEGQTSYRLQSSNHIARHRQIDMFGPRTSALVSTMLKCSCEFIILIPSFQQHLNTYAINLWTADFWLCRTWLLGLHQVPMVTKRPKNAQVVGGC